MLPCRLRFPIEITPNNTSLKTPPPHCRHSYLLRDLSCIVDCNPKVVSRIMDKALSTHKANRNLKQQFPKLSSSHPIVYAPNVDGTRSKLPFDRWAVPKLKKEIHNDDILLVMQALNSIHDLVHNPEKGYEAIRLGLVDRLTDMMLHERDFVREKICMIFFTIAGLERGKRVILKRYKVLHNLALLVEDEVIAVRHKAQLALEILLLSPIAATGLNCADYLTLLLRLIGGTPKTEEEEILVLHLASLKMLLTRDVKQLALKQNALNILIEKMDHTNEKVKCGALECIALLCEIQEGREEAYEKELGELLCKKLFDPSMQVKIKAVGALAFATILSRARAKLCNKCTINQVLEILRNFNSMEGQLMAAKVLSNLSENPKGKALIRKERSRIKALYTGNNEDIEKHKQILVKLLKK